MHDIARLAIGRLLWRSGVILLGSAAMLATGACTKVSTSVGSAPVHGSPGVLRVSDISDPSTLNPMFSGADVAYQLSAYTLEYLVQLDDAGHVIPVLCERVPSAENGDVSADGLTVTYHLRRGVRWSDGVPFGARDVVESWRQVMNPRNNVIIREGYDAIASIDAPDDHTAVVHLRHPYAPLTTRFFAAIQEGPIPVMPAHIIADQSDMNRSPFNAHPIGTGPFVLRSWERNGRMIFDANPLYWRGKPKLSQIVFQAQPSTATELIGFQTHEIDADLDAGPGRLPEYRTLAGMTVRQSKSLRLSVGVMNAARPPFDDVRVRHALGYAIDRAAMLHDIYHDAGVLADEFLPAWSWGYTPDVPRYQYDPARAKAQLEAAGWHTGADGVRRRAGRSLTIVLAAVAGDLPGEHLDELVQSYLRAVGFAVTIKPYPYGLIFDNDGPIRTGNFDLTFYAYSVNFDPASLSDDGCAQIAPHGGNDSRLCDPELDRMEEAAMRISQQSRRKPLYAQIQRRRMDDLGTYPLYFRDRVGVVTSDLREYSASYGIIPQWNAWQWSKP